MIFLSRFLKPGIPTTSEHEFNGFSSQRERDFALIKQNKFKNDLAWIKRMNIQNACFNFSSMSWDVHGDVNLTKKRLQKIKIKFGAVLGCFDISNNFLTAFLNIPRVIYGDFIVHTNRLLSLKNGPDFIDGDYCAHHNRLRSTEGITQEINGDIILYSNLLAALKDVPVVVNNLIIHNNFIIDCNELPNTIKTLCFHNNTILNREKLYTKHIQKITPV